MFWASPGAQPESHGFQVVFRLNQVNAALMLPWFRELARLPEPSWLKVWSILSAGGGNWSNGFHPKVQMRQKQSSVDVRSAPIVLKKSAGRSSGATR